MNITNIAAVATPSHPPLYTTPYLDGRLELRLRQRLVHGAAAYIAAHAAAAVRLGVPARTPAQRVSHAIAAAAAAASRAAGCSTWTIGGGRHICTGGRVDTSERVIRKHALGRGSIAENSADSTRTLIHTPQDEERGVLGRRLD